MPLDHYVTLGRSGLRVSPFCLGTMTFGEDWGWGTTVEETHRILDAFIDKGGNFIDTANVYTRGHSEKIIGDYMRQSPVKRRKAVIATKFFGSLFTGDPNAGGAGRKAIYSSCEDSLRRLQTDFIDLYWMHCSDKHTPIDETMRALDDLVRAGKVRYLGFSDTPAWRVAQAQVRAEWQGWTRVIGLQVEYSLLQRTVEGELVPVALEMGLGITPWSPLKSGVLSGKYTRENRGKVKAGRGALAESALTDTAYGIIDALEKVARELGTTPAAVALAWVQGRPGVTSTIIGARTLEQLEDNLAGLDVKLRPEDLTALDKASEPTLNFPADFLKRAGSFMHGGARVNGEWAEPSPLAPRSDAERH